MLPAYFLSHGSPMLTLDNNKYTQLWKSIGNEIQKPSAVLFISAHWYANKTSLTSNNPQKTIHDFYGFPDELHAIEYNPPNDIQILKKIQNELKEFNVGLDDSWGR